VRDLVKNTEKHHIVPRSLGGSNDESNIVRLTYREHFLAHLLLTKFTSGNDRYKMLHALGFCFYSKSAGRIRFGWQYEVAKRAARIATRNVTAETCAKKSKALLGHVTAKETRIKISNALRGRELPTARKAKLVSVSQAPETRLAQRLAMQRPEVRAKLSLAAKNRPPEASAAFTQRITREMRIAASAKAAEANRGKKRSDETCAKISAALSTPENRAKISAIHSGKKISAETKAKMAASWTEERRAALRARNQTPEWCAKMSAVHLGMKHKPETCMKIAELKRGKARSDEARAAMRAGWERRRERLAKEQM
jgi:hypothetical protein